MELGELKEHLTHTRYKSRTRVFLSSPVTFVNSTLKSIELASYDEFKPLKSFYIMSDASPCKKKINFKLILYRIQWSKGVQKMNALKLIYKPSNFDHLTS